MIQAPPRHLPFWSCFLLSPHPSLWFNPSWTACFPSEYIRGDLTSGSLYQLSPWPGMFLPQISMWFAPPHPSRLHSKFIFALTYSLHLTYQPLFPHNVFYPPPLLCFLFGIYNSISSVPYLILSAPHMCTHWNVLLETKVRLAIGWTSGNRKSQELPTATAACMHFFIQPIFIKSSVYQALLQVPRKTQWAKQQKIPALVKLTFQWGTQSRSWKLVIK